MRTRPRQSEFNLYWKCAIMRGMLVIWWWWWWFHIPLISETLERRIVGRMMCMCSNNGIQLNNSRDKNHYHFEPRKMLNTRFLGFLMLDMRMLFPLHISYGPYTTLFPTNENRTRYGISLVGLTVYIVSCRVKESGVINASMRRCQSNCWHVCILLSCVS